MTTFTLGAHYGGDNEPSGMWGGARGWAIECPGPSINNAVLGYFDGSRQNAECIVLALNRCQGFDAIAEALDAIRTLGTHPPAALCGSDKGFYRDQLSAAICTAQHAHDRCMALAKVAPA